MRLRYRARLWWMGLDNLDRASVISAGLLLLAVFWLLAFLMEVV